MSTTTPTARPPRLQSRASHDIQLGNRINVALLSCGHGMFMELFERRRYHHSLYIQNEARRYRNSAILPTSTIQPRKEYPMDILENPNIKQLLEQAECVCRIVHSLLEHARGRTKLVDAIAEDDRLREHEAEQTALGRHQQVLARLDLVGAAPSVQGSELKQCDLATNLHRLDPKQDPVER